MKRVTTGALVAFSFLFINTAHADPVLQIVCEDCRGPEFSRDFGNFAFNQVFGSGSWVHPNQAGELIIVNLQGDLVFVDLSFVLTDYTSVNLLDVFEFSFGWPTGYISIFTQTSVANSDNYLVNLNAALIMGSLSVGEDSDANNSDSSCSSGGSSGGGNGWGSGSGNSGGSSGGGGGMLACTSAGGNEWYCVEVNDN